MVSRGRDGGEAGLKMWRVAKRVLTSDYFTLFKFIVPLACTDVIADIGEQFLNRSLAHSVNVVDTLAAFGLAYVFIKFFVGMLQEVKQVGVVLVHDRPGFLKLLVAVVVMGTGVTVVIILIAKTQLGVWLVKDLHQVSDNVAGLTYTALADLSVFPLIDAISWYHGGILLQYRHSTLVGIASLAEIMAQIFCVAILLYTPLVCSSPIVVPILSAYSGVLTRCVITLGGFYRLVYRRLSKTLVEKVTILRLVLFISPLVFVLGIQRISRPMINLLVGRFSANECEAATAIAVLTATYPLGRLAYGWLNQLRTVSPTFQKKHADNSRRVIAGRKIAFFIVGTLAFSFLLSVTLYWVPGVSVAILVSAVGIPHYLALLCVDPLRVFAFYCFVVSVRASLTGWLTLHKQTKLIAPSGFIRLGTILAVFFTLRTLGLSGALLGVLALYSGFLSEPVTLGIIAPIFACWRKWKSHQSATTKEETDLNVTEENGRIETAEPSTNTMELIHVARTEETSNDEQNLLNSSSAGMSEEIDTVL